MGLVKCCVKGIPFFGGTLFGNVFYCAILFGGFELAKLKFLILSWHVDKCVKQNSL